MLLLSSAVIGVVAGLLLGGNLWNLSAIRLRRWPALVAALLVQVIIFSSSVAESTLVLSYGSVIYSLTVVAVLAVLLCNLDIRGVEFLSLGTALNALVIVLNSGQMPVDPVKLAAALGARSAEYGQAFTNTAPTIDSARLWFLGDVILTPALLPVRNVLSVGDVIIAIGAVTLIIFAMRQPLALNPVVLRRGRASPSELDARDLVKHRY